MEVGEEKFFNRKFKLILVESGVGCCDSCNRFDSDILGNVVYKIYKNFC